MKRTIRLTESELVRLVKRMIKESEGEDDGQVSISWNDNGKHTLHGHRRGEKFTPHHFETDSSHDEIKKHYQKAFDEIDGKPVYFEKNGNDVFLPNFGSLSGVNFKKKDSIDEEQDDDNFEDISDISTDFPDDNDDIKDYGFDVEDDDDDFEDFDREMKSKDRMRKNRPSGLGIGAGTRWDKDSEKEYNPIKADDLPLDKFLKSIPALSPNAQ